MFGKGNNGHENIDFSVSFKLTNYHVPFANIVNMTQMEISEPSELVVVSSTPEIHTRIYEAVYAICKFLKNKLDVDEKLQDRDFHQQFRFTHKKRQLAKDYTPLVFRQIRQIRGIDERKYLKSLLNKGYHCLGKGLGKSGSVLYQTNDRRYYLKTITKNEKTFIISMLRAYVHYLKNNPGSFLLNIYGVFRLKSKSSIGGGVIPSDLYFMISKNILPISKHVGAIFDLKGSSIGRKYNPLKQKAGQVIIFKDLDLQRKLHFGKSKREKILKQLSKDSSFLRQLGVMDYSLLLGIVRKKKMTGSSSKPSSLKKISSNPTSPTHVPSNKINNNNSNKNNSNNYNSNKNNTQRSDFSTANTNVLGDVRKRKISKPLPPGYKKGTKKKIEIPKSPQNFLSPSPPKNIKINRNNNMNNKNPNNRKISPPKIYNNKNNRKISPSKKNNNNIRKVSPPFKERDTAKTGSKNIEMNMSNINVNSKSMKGRVRTSVRFYRKQRRKDQTIPVPYLRPPPVPKKGNRPAPKNPVGKKLSDNWVSKSMKTPVKDNSEKKSYEPNNKKSGYISPTQRKKNESRKAVGLNPKQTFIRNQSSSAIISPNRKKAPPPPPATSNQPANSGFIKKPPPPIYSSMRANTVIRRFPNQQQQQNTSPAPPPTSQSGQSSGGDRKSSRKNSLPPNQQAPSHLKLRTVRARKTVATKWKSTNADSDLLKNDFGTIANVSKKVNQVQRIQYGQGRGRAINISQMNSNPTPTSSSNPLSQLFGKIKKRVQQSDKVEFHNVEVGSIGEDSDMGLEKLKLEILREDDKQYGNHDNISPNSSLDPKHLKKSQVNKMRNQNRSKKPIRNRRRSRSYGNLKNDLKMFNKMYKESKEKEREGLKRPAPPSQQQKRKMLQRISRRGFKGIFEEEEEEEEEYGGEFDDPSSRPQAMRERKRGGTFFHQLKNHYVDKFRKNQQHGGGESWGVRKENEGFKLVKRVVSVNQKKKNGDGQTSLTEMFEKKEDDGIEEEIFFGVIDITQQYGIKKKAALAIRGIKYDKSKLSSIEPGEYQTRFMKFLSQHFVS